MSADRATSSAPALMLNNSGNELAGPGAPFWPSNTRLTVCPEVHLPIDGLRPPGMRKAVSAPRRLIALAARPPAKSSTNQLPIETLRPYDQEHRAFPCNDRPRKMRHG